MTINREPIDTQAIIEIAHQAGESILEIYQQEHFEQQQKSDNSPLTAADLTSHQLIVAKLTKLTPEIPILSEESATIPWEVRKEWERYWLIDLFDGIKEFLITHKAQPS